MKLTLLLGALAVIPAFSATINCTAGVDSVPVFNPSSTFMVVGDYTLDCTGGTPVTLPSPIPEIDINAVMNVAVPDTGVWILSDGVNLITGTLGLANVVEFNGVPFNPPGTGHVVFTVDAMFVDPSSEPPGFQFKEEDIIGSNFSINVTNAVQLVAVNAVPEPTTSIMLALALGAIFTRQAVRSSRHRG